MKLEIKNINLRSVLFSVYPVIIFVFSLLTVLLSPPDAADIPVFQSVMQVILNVVAQTLVILVLSLVVAFVYNILCSFGIRGLRVEIEDIEDAAKEQE
jgi:hypothetical protein